MTLQQIRAMCLAFPGATEQIQWGNDLVFKIGGKMFCVACTEPVEPPKVAMSFKCDDETFAELVEREGVIPAPYLARAKWVALEQFDTLDFNQLRPLITRAFEIVSAKLPKAKKSSAPSRRAKNAKKANPSTRAKTATTRPSRPLRARKTAKQPVRRATPSRGRRDR